MSFRLDKLRAPLAAASSRAFSTLRLAATVAGSWAPSPAAIKHASPPLLFRLSASPPLRSRSPWGGKTSAGASAPGNSLQKAEIDPRRGSSRPETESSLTQREREGPSERARAVNLPGSHVKLKKCATFPRLFCPFKIKARRGRVHPGVFLFLLV